MVDMTQMFDGTVEFNEPLNQWQVTCVSKQKKRRKHQSLTPLMGLCFAYVRNGELWG